MRPTTQRQPESSTALLFATARKWRAGAATPALLLAVLFQTASSAAAPPVERLTRHVDPFIGTAGTGNTFPGAVVPWGMVSVGAHTTLPSDEKTSGQETLTRAAYVHGAPFVYGFTHTHISGCGCDAQGQAPLTATSGERRFELEANRSPYSGERASPGRYGVRLDRFGIDAESTATARTGLTRFVFPSGPANVLIDHRVTSSQVPGGWLKILGDRTLVGRREEGSICGTNTRNSVFFVVELNRPASAWGLFANGKPIDQREVEGDAIGAYFSFHEGGELLAKVGVSYVSVEGALRNLAAEQPGWNFDAVARAAEQRWEEELGRIRVEGGTAEERTLFYTALYHALLLPSLASDVTGEYRAFTRNTERLLPFSEGYGDKPKVRSEAIRTAPYRRRMNFSLWDTYRTTHPLLALAWPAEQADAVKTLVGMYEEAGALPLIEYSTTETGVMVGDPSLPVIVDSWRKGIRDSGAERTWAAVRANARTPGEGGNGFRRGHEVWAQKGYIPEDRKGELGVWGSVSTSLEYAYADWAAAEMARDLGHREEEALFRSRARSWRTLWDPASALLRPRNADGSWLSPFDPAATAGEIEGFAHLGGPGYVEGNAWQYLFFVPHEMQALVELLGGPKKFAERLDEVFDKGHFVLWNEPDMAYPFLFNHARGEEWRTQRRVREAIRQRFRVAPDGLPGNDDAGTLSAWLVFAMMGLYPDCPGSNLYQITTPAFDRVTIALDPRYHSGGSFVVEARRTQSGDGYIQAMRLDGKPWSGYSLPHEILAAGGRLELELGPKPLAERP